MDQHKSDSVDLSKCYCETPGFCPIFFRRMGTDPPDWEWCQRAKAEDKKVFYDLLSKAPKTENHKLLEFFKELDKQNIKKSLYLLYYLTISDKYHLCEKAQEYQKEKNKTITKYINNQTRLENSLNDLEILCLGHSNKQFDSIQNRNYLKKINLNDIDAGEYSDNKWAEARAFISKEELFSPSAKFVGFTTASWNLKYEAYSRIDEFHNWETCHILLNSKPEDNIVLCADIFCSCSWVQQQSILSGFFYSNADFIGKNFLKLIGLNIRHLKVPFSNQWICHRSIFQKYKQFLQDNEVLSKIEWLVEKYSDQIKRSTDIQKNYHATRIHAYFMEMVSCFWFANQDFIYLPNAERKLFWYTTDSIKERTSKWESTTF